MFQSLDDVKNRWDELYLARGDDFPEYSLPSPGYSDKQIKSLEQELQVTFHASYKKILKKINLDTARFGDASFTNGTSHLAYVRNFNNPEQRKPDYEGHLLNIGGTEVYFFVLSNSAGTVYAVPFLDDTLLEQVADNMEELIIICASIYDTSIKEQWLKSAMAAANNGHPSLPGSSTLRKLLTNKPDIAKEPDLAEQFFRRNNLVNGPLYRYHDGTLQKANARDKPLFFWERFAARVT